MPASPGEALDLGSLHIQLYGVCVLLGFFVWVVVTARLWQRGGGDPIEAAWASTQGDIEAMARELKVSVRGLKLRMTELGISELRR